MAASTGGLFISNQALDVGHLHDQPERFDKYLFTLTTIRSVRASAARF
jgi:hypothetical protein